jgi:hypothetical protein
MDRIPVCNGSNTDSLQIIPGATDSIIQRYCAFTLPESSNKFPKGSKIEPITKSK